MRSYKFRIYPNKQQEQALNSTLTTCRYLYNNALDQHIQHYKTTKKSLSYVEQANWLVKNKNEYQKQVYSQVLQNTLKRLDKTFKNFFNRIKKKQRVGFPRFKNEQRFRSFCYPQSGFKLKEQHIYLSKIGNVKIKLSRPTEGIIKTCTVLKDVDQWFVILTCDTPSYAGPQSDNPEVGIDLGIKTLATLSNGKIIENHRTLKRSEKKLAKEQRRLARKKKGSNRRAKQRIKVAKVHRKIRRQREDYIHKESNKLIREYGVIYFEDLNVKGMVRNRRLSKHISDASWNKLVQFTQYKAENAGVKVVLVNPKNTSQNCSGCGNKIPKKLSDRVHRCSACGLEMDRDLNAAKNISTAGSAGINAQGDNVRQSISPSGINTLQLSLN